jgi:hypothetical protein
MISTYILVGRVQEVDVDVRAAHQLDAWANVRKMIADATA